MLLLLLMVMLVWSAIVFVVMMVMVAVAVVVLLLDGVAAIAVAVLALKVALGLTAESPPNIWWALFAPRRPLERAAVLVVGHGVVSAAPNIPDSVCVGEGSLAVVALAVVVALDLRESA